MSMLAVLVLTARAEKPLVLHQQEVGPALAVRGVARVAELAEDELAVSTLSDLLADAPPMLAGDGDLATCAGEAHDGAPLAEAITTAEGQLDYAEFPEARASLEAGLTSLACLQGPLDTELVARAWYLHGMSFLGEEDKPGAWESFGRTWHYDRAMGWDDTYPPDGKATFEAARAEQDATDLTRVAVIPDGELVVDGESRKVSEVVSLAPGHHVLQAPEGQASAVLDLPTGASSELLLPWALDDRTLSAVATSDAQQLLSWALSGRGHPQVLVYLPDRPVWSLDTTSGTWTPLDVAISELPPVERSLRRPVRIAGLVTTGVGVGVTALALQQGNVASRRADQAPDEASYDAAAAAHERWFYSYLGGLGVTGAGVLTFGASFVLPE